MGTARSGASVGGWSRSVVDQHGSGVLSAVVGFRLPGVGDYRRLKAFRELAELVDAEFAKRGLPLKPGAAADIVAERAEAVADQLRITPRTALNYLTGDALRDLVRSAARDIKEREAAEDARPPVRLDSRQAGLVIAAFTVAARLGVVNGDPDLAADLCEVIAGVGCFLRDGEPPVAVSALLLSNGLMWARLSAESLAAGRWAVLPGVTNWEDDQRVAGRLQADLATIDRLVG